MLLLALAIAAFGGGLSNVRPPVPPIPQRPGWLTLAQLRELAASAGFPDPNLAAAVAMAESSGRVAAANIVTQAQADAWNAAHPGQPRHGPERSFGLWQINTLAHPSYDEGTLVSDERYNAAAALAISSGGTSWTAWGAYTNGSYRKFLGGNV